MRDAYARPAHSRLPYSPLHDRDTCFKQRNCRSAPRRAAAPLELMVAWLPKCSVTFASLCRRLVDGPARSVRMKEHRSQQRKELFTNGLLSAMHRAAARGTRQVRTDGEGSILIDFCSFASGRLSGRTLYFMRTSPRAIDSCSIERSVLHRPPCPHTSTR